MSRIICLSYRDPNNDHISIELEFYQETLGPIYKQKVFVST